MADRVKAEDMNIFEIAAGAVARIDRGGEHAVMRVSVQEIIAMAGVIVFWGAMLRANDDETVKNGEDYDTAY